MAFKIFLLHTLKRKVNGGIYEISQNLLHTFFAPPNRM